MRFNMFVQKEGTAYGALVCTVCSKNITFELEHSADLSAYGDRCSRAHHAGITQATQYRAAKSGWRRYFERPNFVTWNFVTCIVGI